MATELKDYIKCYDGLFEHSFCPVSYTHLTLPTKA